MNTEMTNAERPMARLAIPAAFLVLAACTAPASPVPTVGHHPASHPVASQVAEPSASEDPLAICEGVEPDGEPLEIAVGTVSYAFDPRVVEGPRHCQPFVIVFTNSDPPRANNAAGTHEHNIVIRFENLIGPALFEGEIIDRTTIRYEVPGLPAGEHYLYCSLHSNMTGRVVVAPPG